MSRSSTAHPPPVSPPGPLDWAQLDRATLGDATLAREVLVLFAGQAATIAEALGGLPPETGALAHKVKGSARGIGAWAVAEAAEALEGALASRTDPGAAVTALQSRIAATCRAIAAHLGTA